MKIERAVITAAGKGSRMKYISSVMPKALLPLFRNEEGKKVMRPIIDLISNALIDIGVKKFCLVVGSHGRLLMDYLFERNFQFVVQSVPRGFGDAIMRAEDFTNNEPFFVHADDGILTGGYNEAKEVFEQNSPDGVLLLRKVNNPQRYGIVSVKDRGIFMNHRFVQVIEAEEKPMNPKSDIAISAVYIFSSKIFNALRNVEYSGELELTYGIKGIIDNGGEILGLLLEDEKWLNVGDPDSYFNALSYTYNMLTKWQSRS
ncbi:nucleotidyltransferase [Sulfolobales archaeon HS-7]|nr:nucleotidyltransferase [Sulfolobales archaeon HS-7]